MKRKKKRIMVFTGSRAEYGLLQPVLRAIAASAALEYRLVVAAGHLVGELGGSIGEIRTDGFGVHALIDTRGRISAQNAVAAESAEIMAGVACAIRAERPDVLLVLGDRHETFAAVAAAFCSDVPVAHMAGGDTTQGGMRDDSFRHAISKLSHIHFPFTRESARRLRVMGEEPRRIIVAGSPAVENFAAFRNDRAAARRAMSRLGLDGKRPFVLFTQHPVRGREKSAGKEVRTSLEALAAVGVQTVVCAPNHDPGWKAIVEEMKRFRKVPGFFVTGHLGRGEYMALMARCAAVVGNSSSGVLETPIARVPAVNIGDRQKDRMRIGNVINVPHERGAIERALRKALFDKKFRARTAALDHPFGAGRTARTICRTFEKLKTGPELLNKKNIFR